MRNLTLKQLKRARLLKVKERDFGHLCRRSGRGWRRVINKDGKSHPAVHKNARQDRRMSAQFTRMDFHLRWGRRSKAREHPAGGDRRTIVRDGGSCGSAKECESSRPGGWS